VDQIVDEVSRYESATRSPIRDVVGIAFAGPIAAGGVVTAAPTIWGRTGAPLALTSVLEQRLSRPVLVVNDLTAAAWRYVDRIADPFCLITVSSGIGNKIFHAGRVMLDSAGFGGELGHWTCDPSLDALTCECGGRGHLGGIASGRGTVALAHRMRGTHARLFRTSYFADGKTIDAPELARAVVAGDRFATTVLRVGLGHLAAAITALFAAAGLRRFVIIGGFAQAIGTRYTDLLTMELELRGCFGLPSDQIRQMITLGDLDDDHGMTGMGRLLTVGGSA
jgi:predicted NBD/HSP70 family sugar kinase